MKHFLSRVFDYKNTSLGARSTLNSRGKYWNKLNSTGIKLTHPGLITQKELFYNLGKLFLAYWHKPSMVSLIISLNIICMQFSTRPKNSYLNFCFNSFGAKKQQIAIFEEQFR